MAANENSFQSNIGVIIPYKELENLLNTGKKIEEMERKYQHMERKYVAMLQLYRDVMERVKEIDRYL